MEGKLIEKLVPVLVTESGKAPIALVRTELLCFVYVFVQNNNFFEHPPPPSTPYLLPWKRQPVARKTNRSSSQDFKAAS